MIGTNKVTQHDICLMFGDLVEICHFFYHVNIVFFVVFAEFWLQDYEEVITLFSLQSDPFRIWWHFPLPDIDLPLNTAGTIVEHQHVASSLSSKRFQSPDDRQGMEILTLEVRILFKLRSNLMDSHWYNGLVIYWLLLFSLGHHFLWDDLANYIMIARAIQFFQFITLYSTNIQFKMLFKSKTLFYFLFIFLIFGFVFLGFYLFLFFIFRFKRVYLINRFSIFIEPNNVSLDQNWYFDFWGIKCWNWRNFVLSFGSHKLCCFLHILFLLGIQIFLWEGLTLFIETLTNFVKIKTVNTGKASEWILVCNTLVINFKAL